MFRTNPPRHAEERGANTENVLLFLLRRPLARLTTWVDTIVTRPVAGLPPSWRSMYKESWGTLPQSSYSYISGRPLRLVSLFGCYTALFPRRNMASVVFVLCPCPRRPLLTLRSEERTATNILGTPPSRRHKRSRRHEKKQTTQKKQTT